MPNAILVANAKQLVTLAGPPSPRRRSEMDNLAIVENGALLAIDGVIQQTGPTDELARLPEARRAKLIDATGKVVLPAFVDSHTHLIFANPRLTDFEMRIAGAKYEEIAKAGGGI